VNEGDSSYFQLKWASVTSHSRHISPILLLFLLPKPFNHSSCYYHLPKNAKEVTNKFQHLSGLTQCAQAPIIFSFFYTI
jgi:hypothetical protein